MGEHAGLPVAGYRPQSAEAVELVNGFKRDEERLLRILDKMAGASTTAGAVYNPRWLSIGRTHLEQAFMAINRAVFKPGRVSLPEDV
jgi:hypothetical protein